MDAITIRELIAYDPETGVLTWLERGPKWFAEGWDSYGWNKRYAGKPALHAKNKSGYGTGMVLSERYLSHRVAWLHFYGCWPKGQIDHLNHDRADNRIHNIRDVAAVDNCRNSTRRRDNASGASGVSWHKATGKWIANIRHAGKQKHLGIFDNFGEACAVRKRAEYSYGYHQNHGNEG